MSVFFTRRQFDDILAQWQKWSVTTRYSYKMRTRDGIKIFAESSKGNLMYSSSKPTFNGGPFDSNPNGRPVWLGMSTIGINEFDFPYTAPNSGWYCGLNTLFNPAYATLAYVDAGELITYRTGYNDCVLPSARTIYSGAGPEYSYSKGTTYYGDVSAVPGTYPDNGEKDGFWYVKI